MPKPFFSVCMPVYRGEAFIKKAIDSVQNQTLNDWELIIVDDASDDNTWEIIQAACSSDLRIRAFQNSSNLGQAANWNESLRHVHGEWIGFLPADDIYLSTVLEEITRVVQNPSIALWVHAHYSVHPDGSKNLISPFQNLQRIPMDKLADIFYQHGNIFGEISCFFASRRSINSTPGGFGRNRSTLDLDFWMRLALANINQFCIYSPIVLTETSLHEASDSFNYNRTGQNWVDIFAFMEEFSDRDWKFSVRVRQAVRVIYCLLRYGRHVSPKQRQLMRQSTMKVISHIKN